MNDPLFDPDDAAATPLDPDECDGLIPGWVSTRAQLDELEHAGIADADRWAFSRRREVLDEAFLRALHKRMLGGVWRWAGRYRTSARNIGVEPHRIATDLRQLIDDARYWREHGTWPIDELALRFHHRLVWIHPFPNGNGRHARIAADRLVVALGAGQRFSWGGGRLEAPSAIRRAYVEALRAADRHDYAPLLGFARS